MSTSIAYDNWTPLTVSEVTTLFKDAPFAWCLAGGYAIEKFVGTAFREHGDIDILVYRDEQLKAQAWLADWQLYAADPPGTLREWETDEFLPKGIHDIWGHQTGKDTWQMQLMVTEVDNDEWYSRHNAQIRGKRSDLMTTYKDIPCIRVEVQLLYKSRNQRPKDILDFQACLPQLSIEAKTWLKDQILILFPDGHPWVDRLT